MIESCQALYYDDNDGKLRDTGNVKEPSPSEFFSLLRSDLISLRFCQLGYPYHHTHERLVAASFAFPEWSFQIPDVLERIFQAAPCLTSLTLKVTSYVREDSMLQLAHLLRPIADSRVRNLGLFFESSGMYRDFCVLLVPHLLRITSLRLESWNSGSSPLEFFTSGGIPHLTYLRLSGASIPVSTLLHSRAMSLLYFTLDLAYDKKWTFQESVNVLHYYVTRRKQCQFLQASLPLYKLPKLRMDCNEGEHVIMNSLVREFRDMVRCNLFIYRRRIQAMMLSVAERVSPSIGRSVLDLLPTIYQYLHIRSPPKPVKKRNRVT
jgi:hypothetical protein